MAATPTAEERSLARHYLLKRDCGLSESEIEQYFDDHPYAVQNVLALEQGRNVREIDRDSEDWQAAFGGTLEVVLDRTRREFKHQDRRDARRQQHLPELVATLANVIAAIRRHPYRVLQESDPTWLAGLNALHIADLAIRCQEGPIIRRDDEALIFYSPTPRQNAIRLSLLSGSNWKHDPWSDETGEQIREYMEAWHRQLSPKEAATIICRLVRDRLLVVTTSEIELSEQEGAVINTLIKDGPLSKEDLDRFSDVNDARTVLRRLVEKHEILKPFIHFPGKGKGRGHGKGLGYRVTIEDAR